MEEGTGEGTGEVKGHDSWPSTEPDLGIGRECLSS